MIGFSTRDYFVLQYIHVQRFLNPRNAGSFGCASSIAEMRLKDIDLTFTLQKEDNNKEMTEKKKAAITDDPLLLCVTASQLTKVMNITAAAIEAYLGPHTLFSTWYRGSGL